LPWVSLRGILFSSTVAIRLSVNIAIFSCYMLVFISLAAISFCEDIFDAHMHFYEISYHLGKSSPMSLDHIQRANLLTYLFIVSKAGPGAVGAP
jgi:hypothetical protein